MPWHDALLLTEPASLAVFRRQPPPQFEPPTFGRRFPATPAPDLDRRVRPADFLTGFEHRTGMPTIQRSSRLRHCACMFLDGDASTVDACLHPEPRAGDADPVAAGRNLA